MPESVQELSAAMASGPAIDDLVRVAPLAPANAAAPAGMIRRIPSAS